MARSLAVTTALLLSCLILPDQTRGACPGTYVELGTKCYYFFYNDPTSFLSARQVCENLNGDLAVVKDCNELKRMVGYIKEFGDEVPEGYWIGGTDILNEGSFQWIDGTSIPSGTPFWGRSADSPNEPSGGTLENCAFMASGEGFYFHDGNCQESAGMAPLCQFESDTSLCPAPYVSIAGGCYQFLTQLEETWMDARYICQASAGDLAVVDDCNVMFSIINYAKANATLPEKGFWIGGTDAELEDKWLWVNGIDMDMGVPFWGTEGEGPLQPDDQFATQNCLELWARSRYYFNDVECDPNGGRAPLCQTDPI